MRIRYRIPNISNLGRFSIRNRLTGKPITSIPAVIRKGGGNPELKEGQKQYPTCNHYFEKGFRHRSDGPAIEHDNGYREYWVKGKLHRVDGPAIV